MAKIGKYELVRQLATGGMAEVFLAKTEGALGFEKAMVLKRISPHLLGDPQFLEMFLQEAKLAAQLNHPNIAQVFDFGESNGDYYLTMEHVDGPNLRTLSTQAHKAGKPIPFPLCAKIVSCACEGLAFAHEYTNPKTHRPMNIVHRDVSPDNIVLAKNGSVKVVDFGVAKAAEQLYQTQSGYRKGKLAYMSPEYLKGDSPDLRSDVYALGVVLYELISNKRPYDAENEITLMHAMIYEPMVPVHERRPDVPEELEQIVERALEREPDARYRSCREMQAALDRYIVGAGGPLSSVQISRLIAGLQPELDAAAIAAKTPNRKPTPSGKTPAGPKTPAKRSSGEKKAAGGSGEKRKGATPPKAITFKDLEPSEERTVEMDGPGMVAKAAALYGEGSSSEATSRMTASEVSAAAVTPMMPMPAVMARKIEPAPKPEPKPAPKESEEQTQERTNPAMDVRAAVSLKPSPKRVEPAREPPPSSAVLVLTRKQLVTAAVVALALMLMGAGIAVMVMRSAPVAPPEQKPAPPAVKTDIVTVPPAPTPEPAVAPPTKAPEKPKEEPRVDLEVTSNVPAVVKIGNRKAKPIPYRGTLPPGRYDVDIDDPDTGRWMKTYPVELKIGPTVRIQAVIGKGTLVATAPVSDTVVYVDEENQPRSSAPARVELNEGQHLVRFVSRNLLKPSEQEVTIVAGQETRITAKFK